MQRWIGIAFVLFLASCTCSQGGPPPVAPVPPGGACRMNDMPCASDGDCCTRICRRASMCQQDYCSDKPDAEEGGI